MKASFLFLVLLLAPLSARAQDANTDAMLCLMGQQYAASLQGQSMVIDPKVTMVGLSVDCVQKIVRPQLRATVTQEEAHASPKYNDNWRALYCQGQGIYRMAADAGWRVSAMVQYTDAREQIDISCP